MVLTDGFTTVDALEFEPCPSELPEPVATGTKITLRFNHFEQIQSMLSVSKKNHGLQWVRSSQSQELFSLQFSLDHVFTLAVGFFHVTPIE